MGGFIGGPPNLPPELLLQLLSQQQGQQPAEQMSQQGQFNPANIQAQLQGGPQPFSFAPVQGGLGRNILNALANAGKAATYVAEDPRERQADDARAQQLYETKQKMAMAAGEFGQREKDRAAAAAESKQRFTQQEKDRQQQADIAQQGRDIENRKTDETIRHDKAIEAMKDDPSDKKLDSYVDTRNIQHVVMQRKDNSTYELTYGKVRQPPAADAKPQTMITPSGQVVAAKPSATVSQVEPGTQTAAQYGSQPERVQKAIKPYQDTIDTIAESREYAASPSATNDYALLMNFIGVTKPESLAKLRLNQQEIKLAKGTRGLLGDVEALGQKLDSGQMLTTDQRKSMLDTMNVIERGAQRNLQRLQSTPGMAPQGQQDQTQPSNGRRVIDLTQ